MVVLGVDTLDTSKSARSFLNAVGATYPQVVDSDGRLRAVVHAAGLPVTVVIDRQGQMAYKHSGEMQPADLVEALSSVGVTVRAADPSCSGAVRWRGPRHSALLLQGRHGSARQAVTQ